jgi:hypothetical protein
MGKGYGGVGVHGCRRGVVKWRERKKWQNGEG